jgi:hypothetical protein
MHVKIQRPHNISSKYVPYRVPECFFKLNGFALGFSEPANAVILDIMRMRKVKAASSNLPADSAPSLWTSWVRARSVAFSTSSELHRARTSSSKRMLSEACCSARATAAAESDAFFCVCYGASVSRESRKERKRRRITCSWRATAC